MKTNRAFTLIELLVVIAIIGLLSSVVLASLNTARAKSRDARRLADLHQIQIALELYYSANGSYPATPGVWWGNCSGFGSHGTTGANGYIPNLAPTYIPVLPLDPNPIPPNDCYMYYSTGTDYMMLAFWTVETYTASNNPAKRPAFPNDADFAIYSSGGMNW